MTPGGYIVEVKVIDIFGNDAMTLVPVMVSEGFRGGVGQRTDEPLAGARGYGGGGYAGTRDSGVTSASEPG